ncbi:MAG TPA: F0F1 ATP synthase subunit B [Acidimicrobiales bacterium]|nr:F0F1 ATP synthase subunit B [Acidimicrobiales bacterium]
MIVGSMFLLPNGTFFVELLVLVAILFFMKKYILPPLNKALETRQEKIRASLEAADAARAEAAAAGDERVKVLNAARDQAREIVAAAQATADQVKAEAGGRGQAEYDRIVASAQAEVVMARQRAIDEASAKIGEIVFDLVTKIVGREVDQSAHQDLVREAIAALDAESQRGVNS